jgi:acyl-CoA thioester hydrolase
MGTPLRLKFVEADVDLPMKAMSYEFRHSLWPEEEFEMTVYVGALRRRTFDLEVHGTGEKGKSLFVIVLSPICVRPQSRASIEIPEFLRERLERYKALFPSPNHQPRL